MQTFITITIVAYLLGALLIYVSQSKLLYFPTEEYSHNFEVEQVGNEGETLKLIVLNPGKESAVIYFGGNGESVVHSAEDFARVITDRTMYFVNYRGYGGSSGMPSERAIYSDALAIYEEVSAGHNSMSLIGRSLGSGVAIYLASRKAVSSITLVTPFDSIANVAQAMLPIYPMSILLRDKYDSVSRVKDLSVATLVVTAEQDTIIPAAHSRKLIEAFSPNKPLIKTIKNAGHNNLSVSAEYYSIIRNFVLQY